MPPDRAEVAALRIKWPGRRRWTVGELAGVLELKPAVGRGVRAIEFESGAVELRTRVGGERFRPDGARPRRELKTLLQESRVPPWERARLPLLYCNGELAWVPGVGVACEVQAGPGEAGLEPVWQGFAAGVRRCASGSRKA